MAATRTYVVFRIERQVYALPLEQVTRALRMVAIRAVPDAPSGVRGMINVAGQMLPVMDLRPRLGLPAQAVRLDDRLLIINTPHQSAALMVDEVVQVLEVAAHQLAAPSPLLAQAHPLVATIQTEELIPVLDIDQLLAPEGPRNQPA